MAEQQEDFEAQEEQVHLQRLNIKGFAWLEPQLKISTQNFLGSTGFRNFKIDDVKKKWKMKNCQSFQGFGIRISNVIKGSKSIKQTNTKDLKSKVYEKKLEEISLANKIKKMNEQYKVCKIYEQQKLYRENRINNYFKQQMDWMKNKHPNDFKAKKLL